MGIITDRFEFRFKKAIEYWTIDAFPQAHRERVMYRTNDLSPKELEELNNALLDHCEKAPSIVKIVAFAAAIRAKRKNYVVDLTSVTIPCQSCDGDGLMSAYKVVDGQQYYYSFRCPSDLCENGKRFAIQNTPQWNESFRKEFTPKWDYTKKLNAADVAAAAKRLKSMGFNVPKKYLGVPHGQENSTRGREDQTQVTVHTHGRGEGTQGGVSGSVEQEVSRRDGGEENRSRETYGGDQRPPDQNL